MKKLLEIAATCGLIVTAVASSLAASKPAFRTLQPGQFREINQRLKINVVFVGLERGSGPRDINEARFRQFLGSTNRTINLWDHPPGELELIGNSFNYDYNLVYADKQFEDQFFGFLTNNLLSECVITFAQQYYNNEPNRSLDITDNGCIDATKTEKWLATHAASLGVDTSEYTVFFINWYGRPDFQFHTYLNYQNSDPDPDTGFDRAQYQYWETMAWGGTTSDDEQNGLGTLRRVWYYDLSAGPDGNMVNYSLNIGDLNGDGFLDYRNPPIWEYGNLTGYYPFDDLSGDLSITLRWNVINSQFTTSPFRDPGLAERLPHSIQTDISYFDGDPPATGRSLTKADRVVSELNQLRPFNELSARETDRPYAGEARSIYECSYTYEIDFTFTNCYPGRSTPYQWDVNLYHADHLAEYQHGGADYEAQLFTYTLPQSFCPLFTGVSFVAGGNGFNYSWLGSDTRQTFGNTNTLIHEFGHHFGLTHPHDSFDGEYFVMIDVNSYWFLWMGDETDSAMSYLGLANNLSQFERDNSDRWMTARHINSANSLLPGILASDPGNGTLGKLGSADNAATAALNAYARMDYRNAAKHSKQAYDTVLAIADSLGVQPAPLPAAKVAGNQKLQIKGVPGAETERFNAARTLADPMSILRSDTKNKNSVLARKERGFQKAFE